MNPPVKEDDGQRCGHVETVDDPVLGNLDIQVGGISEVSGHAHIFGAHDEKRVRWIFSLMIGNAAGRLLHGDNLISALSCPPDQGGGVFTVVDRDGEIGTARGTPHKVASTHEVDRLEARSLGASHGDAQVNVKASLAKRHGSTDPVDLR